MFFGFEKLQKAMKPLQKVFQDIVDEHLEHQEDEDNFSDFSYAYLKEVRNTTDPNSSFYKERGRKISRSKRGVQTFRIS
jgi:hypothetical protein